MSTITVALPDHLADWLVDAATAAGRTIDDYLTSVLDRVEVLADPKPQSLPILTPERSAVDPDDAECELTHDLQLRHPTWSHRSCVAVAAKLTAQRERLAKRGAA